MFAFDKISPIALDALARHDVDVDQLIIAARCDKTSDNISCDTCLFSSADTLYVLSGLAAIKKAESTSLFSRKAPIASAWEEIEFSAYSLADIDAFTVEELISGARFVAKNKDGSYTFIAAMTNFCRASVLVFNKYLRKIQNGETFEIDPDDDPHNSSCPKCGMRYPDRNRKICPRCMKKGKLILRVLKFFKGYEKMLVMVLLGQLKTLQLKT